jgi:hypothetical protein
MHIHCYGHVIQPITARPYTTTLRTGDSSFPTSTLERPYPTFCNDRHLAYDFLEVALHPDGAGLMTDALSLRVP